MLSLLETVRMLFVQRCAPFSPTFLSAHFNCLMHVTNQARCYGSIRGQCPQNFFVPPIFAVPRKICFNKYIIKTKLFPPQNVFPLPKSSDLVRNLLQISIFLPSNAPIWRWPNVVVAGALFQCSFLFSVDSVYQRTSNLWFVVFNHLCTLNLC